MDLGLTGKVALVGGSSRGLGRAVARELAREGCGLVLCARDGAALEAVRESIMRESGAEVLTVPANLTDPAAVDLVIAAAGDAFGHVDILVTNTGGPPPGLFESHSPEAWRAAVAQNLESVLNLTRGLLPAMKTRRWGRIVNITSIAVKQPVENLILSNSVRAAVTGFARTLANEVAGFGITVNNVMPGYHRTERLTQLAEHTAGARGISPEAVFEQWVADVPMHRIGEPEDFAALVAFLASERASYITGTSTAVDGGRVRSLL
jgi:3-oxoacyl-[acyl-carrier protein] reductase